MALPWVATGVFGAPFVLDWVTIQISGHPFAYKPPPSSIHDAIVNPIIVRETLTATKTVVATNRITETHHSTYFSTSTETVTQQLPLRQAVVHSFNETFPDAASQLRNLILIALVAFLLGFFTLAIIAICRRVFKKNEARPLRRTDWWPCRKNEACGKGSARCHECPLYEGGIHHVCSSQDARVNKALASVVQCLKDNERRVCNIEMKMPTLANVMKHYDAKQMATETLPDRRPSSPTMPPTAFRAIEPKEIPQLPDSAKQRPPLPVDSQMLDPDNWIRRIYSISRAAGRLQDALLLPGDYVKADTQELQALARTLEADYTATSVPQIITEACLNRDLSLNPASRLAQMQASIVACEVDYSTYIRDYGHPDRTITYTTEDAYSEHDGDESFVEQKLEQYVEEPDKSRSSSNQSYARAKDMNEQPSFPVTQEQQDSGGDNTASTAKPHQIIRTGPAVRAKELLFHPPRESLKKQIEDRFDISLSHVDLLLLSSRYGGNAAAVLDHIEANEESVRTGDMFSRSQHRAESYEAAHTQPVSETLSVSESPIKITPVEIVTAATHDNHGAVAIGNKEEAVHKEAYTEQEKPRGSSEPETSFPPPQRLSSPKPVFHEKEDAKQEKARGSDEPETSYTFPQLPLSPKLVIQNAEDAEQEKPRGSDEPKTPPLTSPHRPFSPVSALISASLPKLEKKVNWNVADNNTTATVATPKPAPLVTTVTQPLQPVLEEAQRPTNATSEPAAPQYGSFAALSSPLSLSLNVSQNDHYIVMPDRLSSEYHPAGEIAGFGFLRDFGDSGAETSSTSSQSFRSPFYAIVGFIIAMWPEMQDQPLLEEFVAIVRANPAWKEIDDARKGWGQNEVAAVLQEWVRLRGFSEGFRLGLVVESNIRQENGEFIAALAIAGKEWQEFDHDEGWKWKGVTLWIHNNNIEHIAKRGMNHFQTLVALPRPLQPLANGPQPVERQINPSCDAEPATVSPSVKGTPVHAQTDDAEMTDNGSESRSGRSIEIAEAAQDYQEPGNPNDSPPNNEDDDLSDGEINPEIPEGWMMENGSLIPLKPSQKPQPAPIDPAGSGRISYSSPPNVGLAVDNPHVRPAAEVTPWAPFENPLNAGIGEIPEDRMDAERTDAPEVLQQPVPIHPSATTVPIDDPNKHMEEAPPFPDLRSAGTAPAPEQAPQFSALAAVGFVQKPGSIQVNNGAPSCLEPSSMTTLQGSSPNIKTLIAKPYDMEGLQDDLKPNPTQQLVNAALDDDPEGKHEEFVDVTSVTTIDGTWEPYVSQPEDSISIPRPESQHLASKQYDTRPPPPNNGRRLHLSPMRPNYAPSREPLNIPSPVDSNASMPGSVISRLHKTATQSNSPKTGRPIKGAVSRKDLTAILEVGEGQEFAGLYSATPSGTSQVEGTTSSRGRAIEPHWTGREQSPPSVATRRKPASLSERLERKYDIWEQSLQALRWNPHQNRKEMKQLDEDMEDLRQEVVNGHCKDIDDLDEHLDHFEIRVKALETLARSALAAAEASSAAMQQFRQEQPKKNADGDMAEPDSSIVSPDLEIHDGDELISKSDDEAAKYDPSQDEAIRNKQEMDIDEEGILTPADKRKNPTKKPEQSGEAKKKPSPQRAKLMQFAKGKGTTEPVVAALPVIDLSSDIQAAFDTWRKELSPRLKAFLGQSLPASQQTRIKELKVTVNGIRDECRKGTFINEAELRRRLEKVETEVKRQETMLKRAAKRASMASTPTKKSIAGFSHVSLEATSHGVSANPDLRNEFEKWLNDTWAFRRLKDLHGLVPRTIKQQQYSNLRERQTDMENKVWQRTYQNKMMLDLVTGDFVKDLKIMENVAERKGAKLEERRKWTLRYLSRKVMGEEAEQMEMDKESDEQQSVQQSGDSPPSQTAEERQEEIDRMLLGSGDD